MGTTTLQKAICDSIQPQSKFQCQKNSNVIFHRQRKINNKKYMEACKTKDSQSNSKQKNTVRGITTPYTTLLYSHFTTEP